MSQKKIKNFRKKMREIVNKEFSSIIDEVACELGFDEDELNKWYILAVSARMMLPEKNVEEFLPSNFASIYTGLLKNADITPDNPESDTFDAFFSFAMKHSQIVLTSPIAPRTKSPIIGSDILKNF